jgi:amino acid adenylation domain-containing protein
MDLAYCFHTSGSTGKPKGVQIHHQALVNFLWAMRELLEFSANDVTLQITPLTFDISGLEIYLPLTCGGHTVVASREDAISGERLAALIRQAGVTVFQATPATWRLLRAAEQDVRCRIALCGGEAIDPSLTRFVRQVGAAAFNVYGPTETTIWSCAKRLLSDGETAIGRPIGNTLVYILDEDRQPVPPGVSGEIFLGGAGVSKGYLNRPELTAQRFIPDPFRADGGLLYATGDLGRYRPDGDIEYLGRSDFQVKVRGFRVELGEIEGALSSASAVQEAAVVAHEDTSGEKQLVAYVVPSKGSSVSVPMLRAHLRRHLP